MKVIIVGGGIAGLTLAYWLNRNGNDVQIIEKASELRTEGYMMDFFGPGYDVAEKMEILDQLSRIHYPISGLEFLNEDGKFKFKLPYPSLRYLFNGRHFNFLRGDLEQVLYDLVKDRVDFKFGETIDDIQQDDDQVHVTLSDGSRDTADVVVGADGVRSRVRSLVFGDHQNYIKHMGYDTAAYIIENSNMNKELNNAFYSLSSPGLQASVYPIRGDRSATFFLYKSSKKEEHLSREEAEDELKNHFKHMGWIVPELLNKAEETSDFYYDEVSQVVMPHWSKGRVVLAGDSCQAVSLMAGQGASLAMTGAYVLARCLQENNDVTQALDKYEVDLKPQVMKTQASGRRFAHYFLPDTRWRIFIRDVTMRISVLPIIRKFVNMNRARIPK
ncbi:2-polyprenyl-6-methoxyphenol hydroxylase [Halobacillus alkaliphilus]|uniref:2-polyprenyl-6-methoxyphenol hydroxylase n=1 Tax=Halobacillus alkaliphilus TaxID=396056 RepID=A0A1I2JSH0_9BACI|nr:FAD-dependent oxidoreductase [Halobacillus alkaliphilus]SFF57088.1 2-polyprenyl-6-methoxyphenol hydroxylase [Halobacillus alkaliphilus]